MRRPDIGFQIHSYGAQHNQRRCWCFGAKCRTFGKDQEIHMTEKSAVEENAVYVGSKPIMNYVLTAITQFNNNAKEVILKARGRAISRAVDVAEIVRNRFMPDVKVKDIKIGTEELAAEEGGTIKVSAIEIFLKK
jgi:DNA-binding protein